MPPTEPGSTLGLIPRTKVNYGYLDVFRALWHRNQEGAANNALADRLGKLFDSENVLLTASGRGALYLLLRALPQAKVIVPAYTCKAVVEAALLAGKRVEYVEAEENGFNVPPENYIPLLSVDAIVIATHQFGIPCEIARIVELARLYGAFVIEDAAPSLGSRVQGKLTGTFGDAAFFSLDSTKLINVPMKGGFLLVQDRSLHDRIREIQSQETVAMNLRHKIRLLALAAILVTLENRILYRVFHNLIFRWRGRYTDDSAEFRPGMGPFYRHKLADWQAGIALRQVVRIDAIVAARRAQYRLYREQLSGCRHILLPPPDANQEWACIRFPVRVMGDKLRYYNKAVDKGVDFAFSFTFLASPPGFTRAHRLAASVLNLPYYEKLSMAEAQRTIHVIQFMDGYWEKNAK